jgi:hypothetical protein
MMGYQMFDMVSWVCSGSSHSIETVHSPLVSRSSPPANLPEKLRSIAGQLQDWPSIIRDVELPLVNINGGSAVSSLQFPSTVSDDSMKTMISNLFMFSIEKNKANWHHILGNFYGMAFMVRWFAVVCFYLALQLL